jgi:hypothetical protein
MVNLIPFHNNKNIKIITIYGISNMKVAICLSGHLRTFEQTYQSIYEQLINKYDCDVFISTWKNLGNSFAYHANFKDGDDKNDPIINEETIVKMYRPVAIRMDDAEIEPVSNQLKKYYNEIRTKSRAHVAQIMCQLYKIWDCNCLKKEHEQKTGKIYDVVIRVRFDVYLKRIKLELMGNQIHLVPGYMGFTDFVFVGPSPMMDDLCDIYTVMSPQIPFHMFENLEHIWSTHILNNIIPTNVSGEVFEYVRYASGGIYDMFGKKIGDYQ